MLARAALGLDLTLRGIICCIGVPAKAQSPAPAIQPPRSWIQSPYTQPSLGLGGWIQPRPRHPAAVKRLWMRWVDRLDGWVAGCWIRLESSLQRQRAAPGWQERSALRGAGSSAPTQHPASRTQRSLRGGEMAGTPLEDAHTIGGYDTMRCDTSQACKSGRALLLHARDMPGHAP